VNYLKLFTIKLKLNFCRINKTEGIMIDFDKLRKVKQIFYHASCPDGTASAVILAITYNMIHMHDDTEEYEDFQDQPEFIALQYNTELMNNLVPQEGQLFVDITPPRDRWEEWKNFNPIVLDHHETSEHITKGLDGVYGTNDKYSGAMLAFEYVYKPFFSEYDYSLETDLAKKWENFATVAMVRDTWKKEHVKWKESCEQSLALQFLGADELIKNIQFGGVFDFDEIEQIGRMLFDNTEKRVKKIASGAFHSNISVGDVTYSVSFFNCTDKLMSDVGDYLLNSGDDIAVGYFYLYESGQQRMCVSLRSKPNVSVSSIAKLHGGGGHNQAAGFTIMDANEIAPVELTKYIERGLVD
jgi:oligoribonuclease NrnB/cAMP/cGMP phosphodiesterase (DHH superfamily)